jgi:hypothetical protein
MRRGQYKHWRGDFYPAELPLSRWFEHCAERFVCAGGPSG